MMSNIKHRNKIIDVTVILTGFNEGHEVGKNIKRVINTLEDTKYSWELILIDDKSEDGTSKIFQKYGEKHKMVTTILHDENIGRGGTVMEGIKKAKGNIVGFLDTDLELSPVYIPEFIRSIKNGADLAIGNRIYTVSAFNLVRAIASKGYIWIVRGVLNIKIKDTEAGCKFFNRKKILPVLSEVKDQRWFFDTEIVVRAFIKGLKIEEIPILFIRKPEKISSVHLFRDTYLYIINLWNFRKGLKRDDK